MSLAPLGCAKPAAGIGGGSKDDDAKTAKNGYAEMLGVCNLSESSSDSSSSRSSSNSNSSKSSKSSSSSNSSSVSSSGSSSSDEDDGNASETIDVVGDDVPAASPSVDEVQNASPPPRTLASEGAHDADAVHEQRVVSVDRLSSVSFGSAVRVPHVTLVNAAEFLPKMELQVSRQGRLMQPAPTVCLSNLNDELQYVVWLSFIQDSGECAGHYMHPESPRPGTSWNDHPLSFSRLKLFAYAGIYKTPITLTCNKNYFLRINIGNVDEYGHILEDTVIRRDIVSTWFVAVKHIKALVPSSKKSNRGRGRGRGPANKRYK